ncbi:hypothetical protein BU15DRAFT_86859 [Melanogaster broomeanus]|nr:hypothetical protein BU15DRAFT_86859 [Melanogaster broomeanus]
MPTTKTSPPPGIPEASRLSTQTWQDDLLELFHNAKDRYPDVVWELHPDDHHHSSEEVWGHKGEHVDLESIVYARAPPSFQARYFSFRPPPITSPIPYSSSPSHAHAQSSVSLNLTLDYAQNSRSPSPYRSSSPAPSTNPGGILRIPQQISPTLFSNELEYLYTGKGLGEAFEFLFDTSESRDLVDAEENRIDKLRKDLVYMWRSRLYSDIRISLTGTFSTSNPEHTTAMFSSHQFMLVSRSPYFRAQLLTWGPKAVAAATLSAVGEPLTVTLPSPPFTPASLHFTLGYIYTGTLVFSHRTYDLDTAFAILRSATYLSLPQLYDETQARIVYEMLHGLYHAFLEFDEYERITGAKWGIGGCRCRQCARRVPRVLEFALSDDVSNNYLERGARRALVGLFGEGWCNAEFTSLPQKVRDSVVKGVGKRTTPANVFPLLFAAQHAMTKLDAAIDAWADVSREMVLIARKTIDECLVKDSEACFEQGEWVEMLEADGVGFEDGERVGWVMEALKRGMSERYAATVYQTLVSSILLRPHATETDSTMLSQTSHIRSQVEETRLDLVRWLRKRWMGIRQEGGFDALEGWSIKEISQEIEVPVEDLLSPAPSHTFRNPHLSRALRPSLIRSSPNDADSDTLSVHSLRASVLSRSLPLPSKHGHGRDAGDQPSPGSSQTAPLPCAPPPRHPLSTLHPRPQSAHGTLRPSAPPTNPPPIAAINGLSTLRIPTLSSATSETSTFRTAPSELDTPTSAGSGGTRSRKVSSGSTLSTISTRTVGTSANKGISSSASGPGGGCTLRPPVVATHRDSAKLSPVSATKRLPSTGRKNVIEKNGSRKSFPAPSPHDNCLETDKGKERGRKPDKDNGKDKENTPSVPASELPQDDDDTDTNLHTVYTAPETRGDAVDADTADPAPADAQTPPSDGILSRRGSTDTITTSTPEIKSSPDLLLTDSALAATVPTGATLDIGIPCIISYIGEVLGERGPWVGVEVPLESWVGDASDGRAWCDGSWGGIRYFDIGGSGSEWEFGINDDTHAPRRRNTEWSDGTTVKGSGGTKREGDQLYVGLDRTKRMRSASPAVSDMSTSESVGLFVRPQQVLYVVDAVGVDI